MIEENGQISIGHTSIPIRSVLESIRVGVIVIDKDSVIRYCNQAVADFVKMT